MCEFLNRKLQAEADTKELEDLKEACAAPDSAGLPFAAQRLEMVHVVLKGQFKQVFEELRDALEVRLVSGIPTLNCPRWGAPWAGG